MSDDIFSEIRERIGIYDSVLMRSAEIYNGVDSVGFPKYCSVKLELMVPVELLNEPLSFCYDGQEYVSRTNNIGH